MAADRTDVPPAEDPHARLERAFIEEYVRASGYAPDKLDELPADKREPLMKRASVYASTRLTEVESRAHFIHDMHNGRSGQ